MVSIKMLFIPKLTDNFEKTNVTKSNCGEGEGEGGGGGTM
jgi:hypothetical protein